MAHHRQVFRNDIFRFRISNSLPRGDVAWLLGVSSSTLARWEEGKAETQSNTVLKSLNNLEKLRRDPAFDQDLIRHLIDILESAARALEINRVEAETKRVLRIEKNLSASILRAAQTDLNFSQTLKTIEPTPFTEDLELFRLGGLYDVKNLLDSLARSAEDLTNDVRNANINSEYLSRHLREYGAECRADIPNPRFLRKRGLTPTFEPRRVCRRLIFVSYAAMGSVSRVA